MNISQAKIKYIVFIIIVLAVGFFMLPKESFSRSDSADVIAVRVIPNPNNYSVSTWYKLQGFSGNPTRLEVDGYQALKDGNTVYVNGANILGKCEASSATICSGNSDCPGADICKLDTSTKMYTNIYVLAQNVEADQTTSQIFDQMVKHFKLNDNKDLVSYVGSCTQSKPKDCTDTGKECVGKEYCKNKECVVDCAYDSECSVDSFCTSKKAEITRDTKRLGDLTDINIALERYRQANGHYPILSSGTYVPNMTLSTWPSWQQTFAKELGLDSLPIDPINKLGKCDDSYEGYNKEKPADPKTCWDDVNKVFADNSPNDPKPELTADSYAYVYVTDPEGLRFGIR
ncbi:hypothetical protein ISS03_04630 [Patescibacteria group bacterium]|nr:hypothetical protein [Patescibacteria group bacterium]